VGRSMTDTIFIGAGGRFGIGKAQATPERSSRFLQSVDDALGYWSKTASEVCPTGDSGTPMLNCLLERESATGGCFGRARAVGSARWGRRRGGHGGKEVCRRRRCPRSRHLRVHSRLLDHQEQAGFGIAFILAGYARIIDADPRGPKHRAA